MPLSRIWPSFGRPKPNSRQYVEARSDSCAQQRKKSIGPPFPPSPSPQPSLTLPSSSMRSPAFAWYEDTISCVRHLSAEDPNQVITFAEETALMD